MSDTINRYITPFVKEDLQKKMVFIGGPRQVGKTIIAKSILENDDPAGLYFNWDYDDDRKDLLAKKWGSQQRILIFDEIHKFPRWKNWLKGIYDVQKDQHQFLITGSARLDVYRRGGDSLLGRYHHWRLHPFALDEIPKGMTKEDALDRLLRVGGFPEPFLDGNERNARRWRKERFDHVLKEDIRDLESVRQIQLIGLLVDQLRIRVGSTITIATLAREMEVAHKTVKNWLEILERMYLTFSVKLFTSSISRSILKPPKIYFYDNADVIGDEGSQFENLVATSLLKRIQFYIDRDGYRYELRYIRDKEGREVDFVILKDDQLEELIEVKTSDDKISRSLVYYAERLNPKKAVQIVKNLKHSYEKNRLLVTDPISYLSQPLM